VTFVLLQMQSVRLPDSVPSFLRMERVNIMPYKFSGFNSGCLSNDVLLLGVCTLYWLITFNNYMTQKPNRRPLFECNMNMNKHYLRPWLFWDVRGVGWLKVTNLSWRPINPIVKGHTVLEHCLILQNPRTANALTKWWQKPEILQTLFVFNYFSNITNVLILT